MAEESEEAAVVEAEAAEAASEDSEATEAAIPTEKTVVLFFFSYHKKIIKNP
jgi:hypothetical protein